MSPLWPAAILSGKAGASALKMRSITVGSVRLQLPTGAGGVALKIFPGGMTTFSARKQPSSIGEKGLTRHLKATRAAATAPDSPELIEPGTWPLISEKSMVISSLSTITFTLSGTGRLRSTPSLSKSPSASKMPGLMRAALPARERLGLIADGGDAAQED